MSKKDVIDTMIGCLSWVVIIVLVILIERGILDFDTVFTIACYIIVVLSLLTVSLMLLWLSLKK